VRRGLWRCRRKSRKVSARPRRPNAPSGKFRTSFWNSAAAAAHCQPSTEKNLKSRPNGTRNFVPRLISYGAAASRIKSAWARYEMRSSSLLRFRSSAAFAIAYPSQLLREFPV
jgi:hypothetical protein